MRKKCKYCGNPCEGEYCFRHKPRKSIKKGKVERDVEESDRMWVLFQEVWKERGPYSEISGKYLGPNLLSVYVDHLLDKAKYPEIKYEKWNLVLCTADEHTSKGNGFPLPHHKELIIKAKEKYEAKKDTKMD